MLRQTDGRRRTRLFAVPIRTVGALALLLGLMLSWTSGGAPPPAGFSQTDTRPLYRAPPGPLPERAALPRLFSAPPLHAAPVAPPFLARGPPPAPHPIDEEA